MNPKMAAHGLMLLLLALWLAVVPNVLAAEQQPSGTVEISEYELAYIFNGSAGGGKLNFQDNTYDFKLKGLGVGGIGAAHVSAVGEVYNLENVENFAGKYAEGGIGFAATDKGKGHVWLKNENGVVLHLTTTQEGLGLMAGVDGVIVTMDEE
jgi:hypothetical protein